jgi:hypothetical protein
MRRAHTDPALEANREARLDFWIDRLGQFGIGPIVHEDFRVLGRGVEVIHEHPFSEAVAKSNEESGWEAAIIAFEPPECWCNWYGSGGREISDQKQFASWSVHLSPSFLAFPLTELESVV